MARIVNCILLHCILIVLSDTKIFWLEIIFSNVIKIRSILIAFNCFLSITMKSFDFDDDWTLLLLVGFLSTGVCAFFTHRM